MHTLCLYSDLDKTDGKEVVLTENGIRQSIMVVKFREEIYAYVNSCPHARTPLNWQEDRFFDLSRTSLLCATHGALFDVPSGRCVAGPATGRALTPVATKVDGDRILTDLAALPWG